LVNLNITCDQRFTTAQDRLPHSGPSPTPPLQTRRKRDDLQHVARSHRIDYARWENVDQQIAETCGCGLHQRSDVRAPASATPAPGLVMVHNSQADEQCRGRHELKIEQRLCPFSPTCLRSPATGMPTTGSKKIKAPMIDLMRFQKDVAQEIQRYYPTWGLRINPASRRAPDQSESEWSAKVDTRTMFRFPLR